MRFQVPQFIEVEDKIVGPFTLKQFIYLAGGAGIIFIIWRALPLFLAIIPIVLVASLSLALAFYKVNNRPFINILESIFTYFISSKLYLWKKTPRPRSRQEREKEGEQADTGLFVPRLSESKLKDVAWSLDVHESIYSSQKDSSKHSGFSV